MKIIIFTFSLFISTSVWAMGHVPIALVQSSWIGKPAPEVVLTKSDGTSQAVVGSSKGQKTIIIFWATWCSSCYDELGSVYGNLDAIQQKGVKVSLVDLAESKETVNKYFNQRRMKWVSFLDLDQYLQEQYHLDGIPTLVFIDENGIVRNISHQMPSDYQDYFGN